MLAGNLFRYPNLSLLLAHLTGATGRIPERRSVGARRR